MKRIVLSIFTAFLLAACFSFGASALTEGDWEFQLLDDEIKITKYIGSGGKIIIPSEIYGKPVTKIDEHIFGESGDGWGLGITSITYPSTIKAVEAFSWNFRDNTDLQEIILSEGIEEIKDSAFIRCINLQTVKLPSTLKKIHSSAFNRCTSLKSIEIPENVEYIGGSVFAKSGIVTIDLSHVDISNSDLLFNECKALETVKLYPKMTQIPNCMFSGSSLKRIDIPATVEKLDTAAFQLCFSLESVILPKSLKRIERSAFYMCESLKEITIPFGVEFIGKSAFGKCNSLKSVYVPNTVTGLGEFIKDSNNCIVYCAVDSYTANFCKKNEISYLTDNSVNSPITVLYNGTRISFHTYDQNPELINSRTLVPLRSVFEAMNATVEWDAETRTAIATRDGITIRVPIDSSTIYKDGEAIPIDVPAQIINSRTMVPVRVIAEAFGADVQWNGNGMTVIISENTEA